MRSGYGKLAVIGISAAIAVFALTQYQATSSKGMNLQALDNAYARYIAKYGKSYGTKAEYELRRSIFE